MPGDELEDLRRLVIDDPLLREQLLAVAGQAFTDQVIEIGRRSGIAVSTEIVEAGLRDARRQWLMRRM